MDKAMIVKRINEIPHETIKLAKQRKSLINRGKLGEAAILQTRIDKLNNEFGRLYEMIGEMRRNEEIQN